ncbi:acyl-CoA thioesterase [Actinocorallia populi]|uniref:acyl-CoA thioesterase n=1 Tax=Actinocorallia populi TaxID=2079200 RepID=UPI0013002099|nr:acyl-CoA thioesterase domain-containing protein [Actinocorallia populi]
MSGALAEIFALERQDEDRFLIRPVESEMQRTFGGQVAAQSLRAAQLTVAPGRPVHSLHASFLRGGQPAKPLHLDVRRARDGRTFSTRHVTASQDGKTIFELTASFHVPEDGEDWQPSGGLDVPRPEELPAYRLPSWFGDIPNFDVRPVNPPGDEEFPLRHPFWFRSLDPVGDPSLHPCVLTYVSDIAVVDSSRAPGSTASYVTAVSLDHAVWFHRPARSDEWLLYSMDSLLNHGARGLARGTMHTLDGTLVASVAQETLLRPAR